MSTDETPISLRVEVAAEDGAAVVEMTSPAVPENGLQAFGDSGWTWTRDCSPACAKLTARDDNAGTIER